MVALSRITPNASHLRFEAGETCLLTSGNRGVTQPFKSADDSRPNGESHAMFA